MVSMNNRRGFFGTIFAAIFGSKVAKAGKVEHFVLKPRSVGMTTYSLQTLTEIWAHGPKRSPNTLFPAAIWRKG